MVKFVPIVAQIPVVPLPPAPIRPVGKQEETHPLLVGAPWIAAALLISIVLFALLKLRASQGAERVPSEWTPWSNGPQVQPIRDPKYWGLIVEAEKESQQSQLDLEPNQHQSHPPEGV
jgi:hypothetical protein